MKSINASGAKGNKNIQNESITKVEFTCDDEKIYSSQSLHIDNSQVNTNINSDFKYESSDCCLEESLVSCKHFDEDLIPEITPSNSTFHNKDLSNYTIKGISLIIDEDLLDISINPLCITNSTILSTNSTELINIDNDSESYEQSLGSSITFKSIFSFKEITEQNIKEITIEDDAEGEADQFIKDVVKEFQITEVIFNKCSAETINQLIVENSLNRITFLRVEKPKGTALQVVDIVMNSRENGIKCVSLHSCGDVAQKLKEECAKCKLEDQFCVFVDGCKNIFEDCYK